MFHAVSPAVPATSTELVRAYAPREGWRLTVLDAGEFDDPDYRANPVNRCYFCKTNLYARIRKATADTIASGTNRDDLSDFRPGLKAAASTASSIRWLSPISTRRRCARSRAPSD